MTLVRSRKLLNASKGQPCTFQIPDVCNGDWTTTVPAHLRDDHTGGAIKASDTSVADACFDCHRIFDGHGSELLSKEDWLFYALRGLQRTIENRVERGFMVISIDAPKQPKSKPRKPRGKRAPIQSAATFPKGPKLQSRNNLRKKERT